MRLKLRLNKPVRVLFENLIRDIHFLVQKKKTIFIEIERFDRDLFVLLFLTKRMSVSLVKNALGNVDTGTKNVFSSVVNCQFNSKVDDLS